MTRDEDQLDRLHRRLEGYWQEMVGGRYPVLMPAGLRHRPATDVYETDEAIYAVVELPGVRAADVELTVRPDELRIRGVRRDRGPHHRLCYHLKEIRYGPFWVRVPLPAPVVPDRVRAHLDEGLLIVELPRRRGQGAEVFRVEIRL